jgi:hypothetical protein
MWWNLVFSSAGFAGGFAYLPNVRSDQASFSLQGVDAFSLIDDDFVQVVDGSLQVGYHEFEFGESGFRILHWSCTLMVGYYS